LHPERQAINEEELFELLKDDQLERNRLAQEQECVEENDGRNQKCKTDDQARDKTESTDKKSSEPLTGDNADAEKNRPDSSGASLAEAAFTSVAGGSHAPISSDEQSRVSVAVTKSVNEDVENSEPENVKELENGAVSLEKLDSDSNSVEGER
jgi:hypothetical protein